jgi:outer membrane protein assembly factor BamB
LEIFLKDQKSRFAAVATLFLLGFFGSGCPAKRAPLESREEKSIDAKSKTENSKVLSVRWRTALYKTNVIHKNNLPKEEEKKDVATAAKPKNTEIDDTFEIEVRRHGSAAVSEDGNRVFVGSANGIFHCLDSDTGRTVWQNSTGFAFDSDPTLYKDKVFTGSGDGSLYAFGESDGKMLWTYGKVNGSIDGRPVVAQKKLLVMVDNNTLVCLDQESGQWLWSHKRELPIGKFQIKGVANPLVADGIAYAGFSDGNLVKLSMDDGSAVSIKNLAGSNDPFTDVDADPWISKKDLFVASFSKGVFSLNAETLAEKWNYMAEGASSFAVADNILYFSTANSKVVALDASTGKPIWIFNSKRGGLSRPVISDQWLFVSSTVYSLLVLDRFTGELLQIFDPGKGSSSPPVIGKNRLFWVSNGEILYCLEIAR